MKSRNKIALIALLLILIILNIIFLIFSLQSKTSKEEIYNPRINPDDFSMSINNKYFTLIPKTKYIYEKQTEEGLERIEVYVTQETKDILGVETRVVWDRVWLNDELIEDTKDWYAQDKDGNVWYFGEESKEIIDNKIISYEGSWEAGVNGAKPGIIMKANPKVNEFYRQEYYKGIAEDFGKVLSLKETVVIPYGTFTSCIKTQDYTPLEPQVKEYKYYCPEIGNVVLEVEEEERVELVKIEHNSEPQPEIKEEKLETKITEEEAKEIALKKVSGKITDIEIEKKFGKIAYVVEIDADGIETDVIIDINTGEVLGIET